ncbi:MAG: hypothetical protein ACOX3V_03800 [Bacillota bacterium]|jgi:hypothetical protein
MMLYAVSKPRAIRNVEVVRLRPFSSVGQAEVAPGAEVTWDSLVGTYSSRKRIRRVRVEASNDTMVATVLVQEGQLVKRGEVLAYYSYLFGLGYTEYVSPCDGEVMSINPVIGAILIKESPMELRSNLPGVVARSEDAIGVWVRSFGDLTEGVAGAGYGRSGILTLKATHIGPQDQGKVIVVERSPTQELIEECLRYRVAGLVVGSIRQRLFEWYKGIAQSLDWTEFLARYWARDAKKQEDAPPATEIVPALVVTEGFGDIPINAKAQEMLAEHEGERIFIDGSMDWAQEPWVFAPINPGQPSARHLSPGALGEDHGLGRQLSQVVPGTKVRILGMSRTALIGTVMEISPNMVLENGIVTPGAKVVTDGGETLTVSFLNIQAVN